MAKRSIIQIDEDKCTGCGECVPSCAEGAIQIVDGVAKLVADNLCDGLGACLGDCPEGAMTIIEREADEFDEQAVEKQLSKPTDGNKIPIPTIPKGTGPLGSHGHPHAHAHGPGGGCPGSRVMQFGSAPGSHNDSSAGKAGQQDLGPQPSELRQWPIQLHLVPPTAPYFKKADVLLAADCTAFAIGDFHKNHLRGRALAVACPKLDQGLDIYVNKLVTMIDEAQINTLNVMIMEVPCCRGLIEMARRAASLATRKVPVKQTIVALSGEILTEEWV